VKIGDLVKITHGTSNISDGTLAMVVRGRSPWAGPICPNEYSLYSLRLVSHPVTRVVRFRAHSLELVNESR
jgi:hypothetical protein